MGDGRRPRRRIACGLLLRSGRDRLWLLPCAKGRLSRSNRSLAVRMTVRGPGKKDQHRVQPQRCQRRVGWRLRDFTGELPALGLTLSLRESWPTESTLTLVPWYPFGFLGAAPK